MSRKPRREVYQTDPTAQVTLAAVLQVRDGVLQALLWQRALEPFAGAWALPGGVLAPDETLEASIRRHLATKVDLARGRAPGAGRDLRRPGPEPGRVGDRDRLPRPRAARRRPLGARRHELAPGRRPPPDRVRPRRDRPLGARPAARQALVLEHRLRARTGDVHAERAPRRLRGGARLRRLGDEPQARARSAAARSCRRAPAATRAAPAGGPPRSSPSPGRRSRSPTRSPPCGRPTCARPGPAELRTARARRVEQRLGRHLALDPLAEDLDGDPRADRRRRAAGRYAYAIERSTV